MQFTKPKSSVKSIEVEVMGNSLMASNCDSHPQSESIKAALMIDGWKIASNGLGYIVTGFTHPDRVILRDELIKAYQGTLNEPDDSAMINAIVKALVIEECESRNDGTPHFGENFDAVKASSYDYSLNWKIFAARKIVELFN